MNIPFTISQFFEVIKDYNLSVFPIQIILYIFALAIIFFSIKKKPFSDKFISLTLGFFWLWMGIVYHYMFFTRINSAAYLFAIFFILQGLIFIYFGAFREKLNFDFNMQWTEIIGLLIIFYALIIYPILGFIFGRTYPLNLTFGLPCPTTIFTFGILLWTVGKVPIYFIIIPFLWSIIGLSAAINLRVYEDLGLIVAGVTTMVLVLINNRKIKERKHI